MQEEIAELSRVISQMQFRNRDIVDQRALLLRRIQGAIATRSLLQEAVSNKRGTPTGRGPARILPTVVPPARGPISGEIPRAAPHPTVTAPPVRPGRKVRIATGAHPPEESTRSVQNSLLWLGGLLFAVTGTGYLLRVLAGGPRVLVFTLLAAAVLAAPPAIARRGLTSTAETLASVGLLFVLLDGYAVWSSEVLRGSGIPGATFAGLVCLVTAGVAAGYRVISHLVAPRFAAVLLLQPVLPLLFRGLLRDAAGWAAVLAAVAAADLVLSMVLRAPLRPGDDRLPAAPLLPLRWRQAGPAGQSHAAEGTPYLRDAVWLLHGLAVVGALIAAAIALAGAHTVTAVLGGAAALVLTAGVGMGGGLVLRRWPLPDVGTGLAAVALIGAVGRVGAVAVPGWGLVITATAVLVVGILGGYAGPVARIGPWLGTALTAGTVALILLGRGFDTIVAPIRAATPPWHADLGAYPHRLAEAAGPTGYTLALAALILTVAAVLMCPPGIRADGAVVGLTLTFLLVPGGLGLPWALAPVLLVLIATGIGGYGLVAPIRRTAWIRLACAAILGFYAAAISLGRPEAGALTLTALTIAGVAIGLAPRVAESGIGPHAKLVAEGAWGGAAFAFPGAVAFATAGVAMQADAGPLPVLAASFLAVAGTLAATAVAQLARELVSPLLLAGTTAGATAVAIASFAADGVPLVDVGIGALLLVSALLLAAAPTLDATRRGTGRMDGSDIAAIAVTSTAIVALARVSSLVFPRYGLATAAALVLLVAVGVRSMPRAWRRGPIIGGSLVGSVVAVIAGIGAVRGAVAVLDALRPVWRTNLATWSVHLSGGYGPQIPLALLLLAAAAAIGLPRPMSQLASAVGVGLAALAAPAALELPWWSPLLISGVTATVTGILAARSLEPLAGWGRFAVATVLFSDTVAASLVRPDVTASTLFASTLVLAVVAGTAAVTYRRNEDAVHLVMIGGAALSTALLSLPAAAACLAHFARAPLATVLTAALAGLCLGLGIIAITSYNNETLLPYATGGVALAGTGIAVATVRSGLPLGVYAAAAALLVVLAELFRAAVIARRRTLSGAGLRETPAWAPRPRQGHLLLLAAGPATVLAVIALAPSLGAALIGPYQWVNSVWTGPPASSLAALGAPGRWVGDANAVTAALLLTLAGALGAVGFGGSRSAVVARAVAVVIPGAAITLLIAPAALRMGWPAGPAAAVLVAALAGLGVALSPTPPDTVAAAPLRQARRLVLVIALLAGGAGLAGSLATRAMTLWALAAIMAAGLVAALYGRVRVARIAGWLVTALAGHLLALVAGLVAGLPAYDSAFLVGLVAAGMLVLAALLPRLRRPDAIGEAGTVEASAYAGAVLALALAARSLPHVAVFTCAWGAVLGVAAARPGRPRLYRNGLIWFAVAHEVLAWWLLMHISSVALPEAYTLAVAAAAGFIGYLESRRHPEISSWVSYGVALVAAFVPSVAIVLSTGETPLRRGLLILASAATVVFGAVRRQQAPLVIGAVVLTIAALHELAVVSAAALVWTLLAIVAAVLVGLGANYEKRRRDLQRLRGALGRLR